jgi:hypothetical protein
MISCIFDLVVQRERPNSGDVETVNKLVTVNRLRVSLVRRDCVYARALGFH